MSVETMAVDNTVSKWRNEEAIERAKEFVEKYGEPDEATEKRLIWHNNGPWLRTMIIDQAIKHQYPVPHVDFLYQFASYSVNDEKASDALKFDGSVLLDKVNGEVGSRCHKEEANFITANMAVEIMEGKRSWKEAREFMATSMKEGKNREYMNSLQFETQPRNRARNQGEQF